MTIRFPVKFFETDRSVAASMSKKMQKLLKRHKKKVFSNHVENVFYHIVNILTICFPVKIFETDTRIPRFQPISLSTSQTLNSNYFQTILETFINSFFF